MEKESIVAPVQIVLDASAAARQLISSDLQCHPGYADLHNRMGLLHAWEGSPEKAVNAFQEALSINPGYFWAASNLAFALVGAGRPDDALETLGHMSPFSTRPEFPLCRAALLVEVDRPEDALEALEDVESDDRSYRYHLEALAHLKLADRQKAAAAIQLAARDCGPLERLYRQLELFGPSMLEKMSPREAAAPVRVFPGLHELHDFFAEIYARHGFRNRALQSFEEGQLVWPERGRHAWNMGRLASWMGESKHARSCLMEAIAHDEDAVDARIALGQEYAAEGEFALAVHQFERAAELRPGYADIRYQLGLAYMDAGRFDDAVAAFRAALSINPSFQFARLNLALALRRAGLRRPAIKEYEQLLAEGRATADVYMNLGLTYLEESDPVRAEDMFRAGIDINTDFPINYYYLGVACQKQGRKQHARTAWRQFLERNRESEFAQEVMKELGS